MEKIWNIKCDGRQLSSNDIIDTLLKNRGIKDINNFLDPSEDNLIDFKAFKNIDKAKDIILDTINSNGTFLIYGDVDTDGCSSTAIAYRYLKHFTDNIKIYLNKGKVHGISDDFNIKEQLKDISTVIVVDSINDNPAKYIEILNAGIKLIVMDHHVLGEKVLSVADDICLISSAYDYPNHNLSGSGVTWKVMKYIDICTNNNYANDLVDLATTGIVGDICDLSENSMENRYICNLGFKTLRNPGIKRILGQYEFNSTAILYSISPLINSANRMENNYDAIKLFIEDDNIKLSSIIQQLTLYKEQQKVLVDEMYLKYIKPQSIKQADHKCLYFLVEGDSNFAGLLANKAVSEFNKPVIVLHNKDNNLYQGSMRAYGIDDFRAMINSIGIATCEGHEQAAGISIPKDKFKQFYLALEELLKDYTFEQKIDIDMQLSIPQISPYLIAKVKNINKISGNGFPKILIALKDISKYYVFDMSNHKHMAIKCDDLSLIKWNMTNWDNVTNVPKEKTVSVVGTLEENYYKGMLNKQVIIDDYKFE